jgi:hypothetical protein
MGRIKEPLALLYRAHSTPRPTGASSFLRVSSPFLLCELRVGDGGAALAHLARCHCVKNIMAQMRSRSLSPPLGIAQRRAWYSE